MSVSCPDREAQSLADWTIAIYNFSQGETGLAFLACTYPNPCQKFELSLIERTVAVGSLMALIFCLWWDHILFTAKRKAKPWSNKAEFQRLPLACLGGPLFTAGLFWIGWGAKRDVHWIVPILGGLPLGIGFVLIFVALANYLVDAYKIYSASAMGATSISRSTFGVVLPFAAKPMYRSLGVAWACSLLGFLSLVMCLVPYAFIRYGERLRASSPMCQELAKQDSHASTPVQRDDESGKTEEG